MLCSHAPVLSYMYRSICMLGISLGVFWSKQRNWQSWTKDANTALHTGGSRLTRIPVLWKSYVDLRGVDLKTQFKNYQILRIFTCGGEKATWLKSWVAHPELFFNTNYVADIHERAKLSSKTSFTQDAGRNAHKNSNANPLMLLVCSVNTPIDDNRSHLLLLRVRVVCEWGRWNDISG